MEHKKIMIIDGNSILNRAFYAMQGSNLLATKDGLYTNGIFGFLKIMNKFLDEEKPEYLCVTFDLKAPTFRHEEYEGYKANRKGMPKELAVQVPVIKEVLDVMNIRRIELEGFEADDLIGTISYCSEKQGLETVIVTGDRDALQLISEKIRVKIPKTNQGKTHTEDYDYQRVLDEYKIFPEKLIDVKGLMGDKSDNIPGIPGVGEKTALELIEKFGSIEELYNRIDEISKEKLKIRLIEGKELAFLSKKLATIDKYVPGVVECNVDEFKCVDADKEKLYEIFKRLEFKSFIEKYSLDKCNALSSKRSTLNCVVKIVESVFSLDELVNSIKKVKEVVFYNLMDKNERQENLYSISFSYLEEGEYKSFYIEIGNSITEEILFGKLKEIFENQGIRKIGHGIKDFVVYLKNRGIELKGIYFDTIIGAYVLNPSGDKYEISHLSNEFLNEEIESLEDIVGKGKKVKKYSEIGKEKLSEFMAVSCKNIYKLFEIISDKIKENDQEKLYYEVELPLLDVLADMEYWGFKVNEEELNAFSRVLNEKLVILTKDIYNLAGEEFNINSPKQMGVILFDKLGLPSIKKTKTGYSTDAETLEKLEDKHDIINKILEYRQLAKLKSTYVEGMLNVLNQKTGKIHSKFNQVITATGRISSTEPNLQNIPIKLEMGREIRKVFVPSDESFVLLDADYSQIELRVLAHISDDDNMVKAFLRNEDIHTSTASKVFETPKEEITPIMRARAKAVNFGIVYGIGDFSLSKDLGITKKEAKSYIDEYFSQYPDVRKYMNDTVAKGKDDGYVKTLYNRRRYLPELKSSNFVIRSFGERIAMNTPIQGTAADIIKVAMVLVYKELKKRQFKSRLILQVHDELIVEAFIEEKEEVKKILKESMENALVLKVPLTVELKEGNNWYQTK